MLPKSKIIVALDTNNFNKIKKLIPKISKQIYGVKVGYQFFFNFQSKGINFLRDHKLKIFFDFKLHDIPNTVANACRVAVDLDIWMLNVHAAGGCKMMEAAYESLVKSGSSKNRPLLVAVTVLTSMSSDDLLELGITNSIGDQVLLLSKLAKSAGLDGVVCSGMEVGKLRHELGKDFCLVTPGIRLDDLNNDDQERIMTPYDAIKAGSNYLVIGRPITRASDPVDIINIINKSINLLD